MSKDVTPDWVQFHLGAYIKNTRHLTTLQKGAYTELLWAYYSRGRLPTDDRALATIAGLSMHQWAANRAALAEFFDENWKHERVERELATFRAKSEARAKAGALGGAAKAARAPARRESPQDFFDKGAAKPNGVFEAKPLIDNDPALANATILPDRVKSQDLEIESSSKDAGAQARDDDDKIFKGKVKEALGPKTPEAVASGVVPALRALIADGCDFTRDVLPKLRDIATTGLKTPAPAFLGQQIRQRRDARLAADAARGAAPPPLNRVFVQAETRQWQAWRAYNGKSSPAIRNGSQQGWWFASEWPPGYGPEAEGPLSASPSSPAPRFKLPDMAAILNHARFEPSGRSAP